MIRRVLIVLGLFALMLVFARVWTPDPLPAEPVPIPGHSSIDGEMALKCLTVNLYKEARGEPVEGQQAVVMVVRNRMRTQQKDICDVVFEPAQFSWTLTDTKNGRMLPEKMPDIRSKAWAKVQQVAQQALYMPDFTNGATHYHEVSVHPAWANKLTYVGQYGNHLFYR